MISTSSGSAPEEAFQSLPEGARVYTAEGSCTTPCQLHLRPDQPHSVTITSPGYKEFHVDLQPQKVDTGVPSWISFGPQMTMLQPNPVMAVLDCADQKICGGRAFIRTYGNPTPPSPR